MEDIKLEESLDFVDAIDFANGLRPYDEGAKDVIHAIGNGIKKVFGSNAGTAQRNFDDAQRNLQTAQLNQQAAALNAQANQMNAQLNQKASQQSQQSNQQETKSNVPSGSDAAQNIINILQKSFKKAQITQQKATNEANREAKNQNNEKEKQQKTQPTEGSDEK